MSTLKNIEKIEKIKKLIILLTVGFVIFDILLVFANPGYLTSSSSLMGLGFSSYHLIKEYVRYRIEHQDVSKVILILSLVLAGFSLYRILLNLVSMVGVLT